MDCLLLGVELLQPARQRLHDEQSCSRVWPPGVSSKQMTTECRMDIRAMKTGKIEACAEVGQRTSPICTGLARFAPAAFGRTPCRSWVCERGLAIQRCESIRADLGRKFCKALPGMSETKEERFDPALMRAVFGG